MVMGDLLVIHNDSMRSYVVFTVAVIRLSALEKLELYTTTPDSVSA